MIICAAGTDRELQLGGNVKRLFPDISDRNFDHLIRATKLNDRITSNERCFEKKIVLVQKNPEFPSSEPPVAVSLDTFSSPGTCP